MKSSTLKGHQTQYEDALLHRLYEVVPEGVQVTVVADRGFADCKLFAFLNEELGFGYVIRLKGHYYITNAKGDGVKRRSGSEPEGGRVRFAMQR